MFFYGLHDWPHIVHKCILTGIKSSNKLAVRNAPYLLRPLMKSFVSSVVLQKKVPLWKRHIDNNIHVVTFDHKRRQMSHDKAMTYMYERISPNTRLTCPPAGRYMAGAGRCGHGGSRPLHSSWSETPTHCHGQVGTHGSSICMNNRSVRNSF